MSLRDRLAGAVVMAPMTKGSNLPYRRLCIELGAKVLISEMVVARRLKQRRQGEYALIRRAPDEPCFAVQLCGNQPDEMAWAAALVESRGADFIDINLGCPIDHFTRKGLGAALGRQPTKVRRIVEAMCKAVQVPVTVKIRLGWNADTLNYMTLAQAAVDGGASAIFVHGRTREARYRNPANWESIAEIAAGVPVPVIGNGDLLFAHECHERLATSGCTAVMTARGALTKPWLFSELTRGYWDITAEERLTIYRRYVTLALEHWGDDDHGRGRLREFLKWHLGFWCRYAPRRADDSWPTMQQREGAWAHRSPLEALLARSDEAAIEYMTDELLNGGDLSTPPAVGAAAAESDLVEAG
ncbi:MAG TPA: tRNA-dihydrouridine synthase family protein [Vicinamibacterales bacterium]|jgi:tRNA-dihydrouridine synthase 3|nr:tRNA-dihydrouridine synthase family protein [Vicinamibacterales bacterium]